MFVLVSFDIAVLKQENVRYPFQESVANFSFTFLKKEFKG